MKKPYTFIFMLFLLTSISMQGKTTALFMPICPPFIFNFNTTQASCPNNNDGTAQVITFGGIGNYTYQWDALANNQIADAAVNLLVGNYSVIVTDSLGCTDTGYVSISSLPTSTPSICMVTVDAQSINNIIYWDKTSYTNADSFIVYRDIATNSYQRIGAVSVDSMGQFIDTSRQVGGAAGNGDPNTASFRYKIQLLDTCGNYSNLSPYHNTIYMTDNGIGEFNWTTRYNIEGWPNPVINYVLICDTANVDVWGSVNVVNANDTVAMDPGFLNHANIANWRIKTIWPLQCDPTRSIINTTRSNIKHGSSMSVGVNQLTMDPLYLYLEIQKLALVIYYS